MLKKSSPLLALVLISGLMSGCSSSSSKSTIPDEPPEVLFQQAQLQLDSGDYTKAVEVLEALDSRYPFGPYSNQVQLDLIYAYYKNADTAQAIANIDRFIRLNPAHPDIDYVFYMRGLTNMQADYNFFQSVLQMDRFDRDPAYARQAFADLKRVLVNYPNSKYAADARSRLIYLKDRLSRYDLAVADFYMRRKAWLSAANRGKYLLETYPDTQAVQPALEIMIQAYDKLQMPTLAEHARQVLATNYPNDRLARKSS